MKTRWKFATASTVKERSTPELPVQPRTNNNPGSHRTCTMDNRSKSTKNRRTLTTSFDPEGATVPRGHEVTHRVQVGGVNQKCLITRRNRL